MAVMMLPRSFVQAASETTLSCNNVKQQRWKSRMFFVDHVAQGQTSNSLCLGLSSKNAMLGANISLRFLKTEWSQCWGV